MTAGGTFFCAAAMIYVFMSKEESAVCLVCMRLLGVIVMVDLLKQDNL